MNEHREKDSIGKGVFFTDAISHEEIGLKAEKEYFITGYISTADLDRDNEIVSREAMADMLQQLKAGNIKLDIEHQTFTGENDIPIGRIVDAKLDEKGLWVKATLNKNHTKFEEVWKSIKAGFLDAFSIAYKVRDVVEDFVNGIQARILRSVELLNVAITGNPMNPHATMTESFAKSMKSFKIKDKEGKTMSEEKKSEEVVAPEVKVEAAPVAAEPAVEAKAPTPAPAPAPVAAPVVAAPAVNPMDTIKSLEKTNAELKAEMASLKARIEAPVLKSIHTEIPKLEPKIKDPFDMIG
jgi:HK97 family phage prohead protease